MSTFSACITTKDQSLQPIITLHYGFWQILEVFGVLPCYTGYPGMLSKSMVSKLKEIVEVIKNEELPKTLNSSLLHHLVYYQDIYITGIEQLILALEQHQEILFLED